MIRSIQAHPFFADKSVMKVEPFPAQGYCNQTFLVTTSRGQFVWRKLLGKEVNREAEVYMMQLAYTSQITPALHLYDQEQGIMLFDYVEGVHKQSLSFLHIRIVAEVLKKLHAIEYDRQKVSRTDIMKLIDPSLPHVSQALQELHSFVQQPALCHNDLNPYNLIWKQCEVKLIDFEYAGINDIYFDLASVSMEFGFSEEEDVHLLQSYFGNMIFFKKKLDAYKTLYRVLCETWFEKNGL